MMMKKIIALNSLILGVLIMVSCDNKEMVTSPTQTIVKGKLEGITGTERILLQELQARNVVTVDTIVPDMEGNFELGPNVPNYGFYRIFVDNKNFVNLILSPNDTVDIYAQLDDLEGTYQIKGSAETQLLKSFNDMMNDYVDQMDSLNQLLQAAQMEQNVEKYQGIYRTQMEMNGRMGDKVRQFVRDNNTMLASLSAVQKLDPDGDFDLLVAVQKGLEEKLGGQQIYADFSDRIEQMRKLRPGAILPDITLPNIEGRPTSLFATLREVTLVDFWASWCKPCRAENPNVVAAYQKYRTKGFEVVGISLDKDGDQWLAAIEADKLTWPHMSDIKGWQSAACPHYNIKGIPANFLIDSEGKILAKNLRGPALHEKLEELLGSDS